MAQCEYIDCCKCAEPNVNEDQSGHASECTCPQNRCANDAVWLIVNHYGPRLRVEVCDEHVAKMLRKGYNEVVPVDY
jgi:hypothetical protein